MDSNIVLSILVTTYNIKNCIQQTIDSILSERIHYNYEILIGDDGSSDGTLDVIRELQSKYPTLISFFSMDRDLNKQYLSIQRASRNRLNLLKHAKGRYLIYLDGDDFFTGNGFINKSIDFLEKSQNRNYVCIGHNMNFYYENTQEYKPIMSANVKEGYLKQSFYWRNLWLPAEAFVFRNVIKIEEILNNKRFANFFDDNLITYHYIQHGKIYYEHGVTVNYRQNPNGFLNQNAEYCNIVNMYSKGIQREISKDMKSIAIRNYPVFKYFYLNKAKLNISMYENFRIQAGDYTKDELSSWYERKYSSIFLFFANILLTLAYYNNLAVYIFKTKGVIYLLKRLISKMVKR